jgi:hypothetical protein
MAIALHWDEEVENLIVYVFEGGWTIEDYNVAFQEELRLAATLDGKRYDTAAIMSNVAMPPLGDGSLLSAIQSSYQRSPENWHIFVAVIENKTLTKVYNSILRILPMIEMKTYLSVSIEGARTIILKDRAKNTPAES